MWQIIGAGAIGCLNAAHLLRTMQKVHLITREKMVLNTLKLTSSENKQYSFNLSSSQSLLNNTDPILVCVKAMQVSTTLCAHKAFIGRDQVIILMHNGMGCAEQVAKLFPSNPIICATTSNAALLNSPFNVTETGIGSTLFGHFNSFARSQESLIEPFKLAFQNVRWEKNINEKLWLKLIINISINPLTAVYQVKNGELQSESTLATIRSLIEECLQVTSKLDLPFNSDVIFSSVLNVIKSTSENYSSMNRDIFYQRKTEIEFINGYILKKGAEFNIHLPHVQSFYNQIIALENHSSTQ